MQEGTQECIIHRYRLQYSHRFQFRIVRNSNHACNVFVDFSGTAQRYTYRVLQTIQMKLILLCVWAEQAVLVNANTALKLKYEI